MFPASVREDAVGYRVAEKKTEAKGEAKADHGDAKGKDAGKKESHGLGLMQFAVTNTMLSAWLTSVVMLVFFIGGGAQAQIGAGPSASPGGNAV